MSLANLDDKALDILKPLFITIKNSEQLIDYDKFMLLANKLYQILPQSDKNVILKFGKPQGPYDYNIEQCTFSPKINRSRSPASSYIRSYLSPKSTIRSNIISPKSLYNFAQEKSLIKKISSMKTDEDSQVSKELYQGSYMSNTMKNFLNSEKYKNPF